MSPNPWRARDRPADRGRKPSLAIIGLLLFLGMLALSQKSVRDFWSFTWGRVSGGHSLADRLEQYGPRVASRLAGDFARVGIPYPPQELAYVAFKDSRVLEVYARAPEGGPWRFVRQYPILGASGRLGPKLAEGDNQVPEGLYRAEFLNPNSLYHLSIRLNYPNEFDRQMAQKDGRTSLGGDIMIHGSNVSIGCLAVGDEAAEDLFVLAGLVSKEQVRILVSPTDFRINPRPDLIEEPPWVRNLYRNLRSVLQQFEKQAKL